MNLAEPYSATDRILHRLAFSTLGIQNALSDMEDRIYAKRIARVEIRRPTFITSLPRAGTTLLLEVLHSVGAFATHSYRQMPFLFIPLLWNAVSGPLRISGAAVERAHGDGMKVGYDSVEGFEEVIWHRFWPEKYRNDRIATWGAEDSDPSGEFEQFMKSHMRKLIALYSADDSLRYLSKNNASVARIAKITRMFPDAIMLIPFRNPVGHVGSMLRQHLNFKAIHVEDKFAKQYMKDICHFDFGANFTPIDFGGWLDQPGLEQPDAADMWLRYWCAAFRHVLDETRRCVSLIDYDACCENPLEGLNRVGRAVGLEGPQLRALLAQAPRFRASTGYSADSLGLNRTALAEASAIHAELMQRSLG